MAEQSAPNTTVGPLAGIRVVEIAGIGPTQFCGMLLADMGARILRLRRPGAADPGLDVPDRFNLMNRGRPTVDVDLKSDQGREFVLRLCERADALFEGFRPGVMERLGLGPDDCMRRGPDTTPITSHLPARFTASGRRTGRHRCRSTWSVTSAAGPRTS
jgi:crotonobetainyl-CoA:carnitine CoA-transferase CaiB-like acyl-CoA transferase